MVRLRFNCNVRLRCNPFGTGNRLTDGARFTVSCVLGDEAAAGDLCALSDDKLTVNVRLIEDTTDCFLGLPALTCSSSCFNAFTACVDSTARVPECDRPRCTGVNLGTGWNAL